MENMKFDVIEDTGEQTNKAGRKYRVQLFRIQLNNPYNQYSVKQVYFTRALDDDNITMSEGLMLSEPGARKKYSTQVRNYKFEEAK